MTRYDEFGTPDLILARCFLAAICLIASDKREQARQAERYALLKPRLPRADDREKVAAEFSTPADGSPNPDTALIGTGALRRGLILLSCGVCGNVIRFLAPRTIPDAAFHEAPEILRACILAPRKD